MENLHLPLCMNIHFIFPQFHLATNIQYLIHFIILLPAILIMNYLGMPKDNKLWISHWWCLLPKLQRKEEKNNKNRWPLSRVISSFFKAPGLSSMIEQVSKVSIIHVVGFLLLLFFYQPKRHMLQGSLRTDNTTHSHIFCW